MDIKDFKSAIKNVPDDYEIQIWDIEEGEWRSNLEGMVQVVFIPDFGE